MRSPHADVLRDLDPAEVSDPDSRQRFAGWSDADLVDAVATVVAAPRAGDPTSFVLHAPLEVLARTALLPHVRPADRDVARTRLAWLASTYAEAPAVGGKPTATPDADPDRLIAAIGAGELDDAAFLGHGIALALDAEALTAALADTIVPSLAAAAHGSIFLYLLPRVAARSELAAAMVGTLCREVARNAALRLTWHTERRPGTTDPDALDDSLRRTPLLGSPGSNFIHPLLHQAESTGTAAAVVGPHIGDTVADPAAIRRRLLRVAATSMLHDDPAHAPYGWTHAMTIAQAISGIAGATSDPASALAVAATHVVAFRAGLGSELLEPTPPDPVRDADSELPVDELLDAGPAAAAAAVLAGRFDDHAVITVLATNAAAHPDAHLAKYTVACLDARRTDPAHSSLYLAAAAHLGAWWRERPITDDPVLA